MRSHFLDSDALLGLDDQKPLYQVFRLFSHKSRDFEFASKYLLIKHGCVLVFKGKVATQKSEKNDAAAPEIHLKA